MFKTYSLTSTGIIIAVVGTLLVKTGFSEGCSNEIITTLPVVIGSITAWIGNMRNGHTNILGVKK